jgi:hypothetical protein
VFRVVCGKLDEREFGRAGDRGALAKSASPPIMNLGGMVDLDAVHSGAMTVPTEAPAPPAAPASPLDDVLRRVNRIRTAHGADPLYELPAACTAWEGGGCVLERAFEDLGVLIVDYERAYGRHIEFKHGLGDFARDFDAGRYPELFACR